jgi:DNA helicase-2/ATP-dependent DNA helicase PcrA
VLPALSKCHVAGIAAAAPRHSSHDLALVARLPSRLPPRHTYNITCTVCHVAMSDILQGLNNAQRTAVTSEAEVLQVLAPPGSGKTKTLTSRVAHLVRERHFKPWNIIVCTFTVKAAREMQERIRGFVGEELERKLRVGTFHKISLLYLRRYGKLIGIADNFGVADTNDTMRIISRIVKQCKFTLEPKVARERISRSKSQGIDSEQFLQSLQQKSQKRSGHTGANQALVVEKQEFAEIFSMYQEQLDKCNLLDFDDILLRCVHLLRKHPECVANIEAVLVDEFQDTNGVQYELMSLLAQQKSFITIVGDPDQSIYGWRSADIKNLGRMKSQWRDTLTVNLEENYRSSGAILRAAQKVIEQDENRPPKQLQATHSMGQRPVLRKLPNAKFEADWIITEIKRLIALSGGMLSLSDFAILLRTATLSRNIEAAFGKAGLAYRMIGGKKFFDRVEIKLLIDYLRVIDSPAHSEAVERIINEPSRQIGEKTVESLRQEAQSNGQSLWDFVRKIAQGQCKYTTKLSAPAMKGLEQFHDVIASARNKIEKEPTALADLIKLVLNKLSFEKYLKKKYPEDYEVRWANVEELMAQATDASTQPEEKPIREDEGLPPIEGTEAADESPLTAFLANVALSAATDQKAGEDEQAPQATVSTLHAAKGLEWPVVFIPACYKGSIPHSRAEDNDEERRLLYVGMTRAQVLLSMTFPLRGSAQNEGPELSPFLSEPGMSNFFEEHGPSISERDVRALAITLGREQPTPEALAQSKKTLERDEDNYWPLTGEWPPEEVSKLTNGHADDSGPVYGTTRSAAWVTASTTMQGEGGGVNPSSFASGFVSVRSNYSKIMEEQEEKRLRALDKRAAEQEKVTQGQAPKGRKRQMDGQGTISNFFGKKPRAEESLESSTRPMQQLRPTQRLPTAPMFKPASAPLRDVSNINKPHEARPLSSKPLSALQHRVRAAPLVNRRPLVHSASDPVPKTNSGYVFLSSPPPQPEEEDDPEPEPTKVEPSAPTTSHLPSFKPASTFHSTSMQGVSSQRRTLGIGKMKPWSARGGKR